MSIVSPPAPHVSLEMPVDAPSNFSDPGPAQPARAARKPRPNGDRGEGEGFGTIPSGISVAPSGRLREDGLPENDRLTAAIMHVWWLALALPTGPLALAIPIVLWVWRKEKSPFLDDHGREAINFVISQVILSLGLAITGVGVILLPVIWIVGLVSVIRATAAAWSGEYFRYPITIRLIG